jgi:hypothetical protein
MEEAVSGVKGELAIKVYGNDLKLLEQTGDQIVKVMGGIRGVEDLGMFRVIGQPNLNFTVDRRQRASPFPVIRGKRLVGRFNCRDFIGDALQRCAAQGYVKFVVADAGVDPVADAA